MSTPAPACAVQHVAPHVFASPRDHYRVRPARPGDEGGLRHMLEAAAPEDIRLRFFRHVRRFPHEFVEPLTRMDDRCHFAFVATAARDNAHIVASAMMVVDADGRAGEFAIFVAREAAGQRLGSHLLECLIREGRGHGLASIYGLIMAENEPMIDLARRLGFGIACDLEEPGCMRATLQLVPPAPH